MTTRKITFWGDGNTRYDLPGIHVTVTEVTVDGTPTSAYTQDVAGADLVFNTATDRTKLYTVTFDEAAVGMPVDGFQPPLVTVPGGQEPPVGYAFRDSFVSNSYSQGASFNDQVNALPVPLSRSRSVVGGLNNPGSNEASDTLSSESMSIVQGGRMFAVTRVNDSTQDIFINACTAAVFAESDGFGGLSVVAVGGGTAFTILGFPTVTDFTANYGLPKSYGGVDAINYAENASTAEVTGSFICWCATDLNTVIMWKFTGNLSTNTGTVDWVANLGVAGTFVARQQHFCTDVGRANILQHDGPGFTSGKRINIDTGVVDLVNYNWNTTGAENVYSLPHVNATSPYFPGRLTDAFDGTTRMVLASFNATSADSYQVQYHVDIPWSNLLTLAGTNLLAVSQYGAWDINTADFTVTQIAGTHPAIAKIEDIKYDFVGAVVNGSYLTEPLHVLAYGYLEALASPTDTRYVYGASLRVNVGAMAASFDRVAVKQ